MFLVDLLELAGATRQLLVDLLGNPAVLKLGFGLDEDIPRLQLSCAVARCLDLQQALLRLFALTGARGGAAGKKPALAECLALVCGKS